MLQVVYASGPALPSVLKLQALARVVGEVARARGVQLEGGLASGDKVLVEGSLPVGAVLRVPMFKLSRSCQWNLLLRGRSGRGLPHPKNPHT
jgi:hypothetical protein